MRFTRYVGVFALALAIVAPTPVSRSTTVAAQEAEQAPAVTTEDVGPASG